MAYFGHERKRFLVASYELPQYWQDGSLFKKSSYECAINLLALFFSWQCIIFSLLVPKSNSFFSFRRFLLSFDLNEATKDQSLVSCGYSFQALIVDGRKLLYCDVVLKIGILYAILLVLKLKLLWKYLQGPTISLIVKILRCMSQNDFI